MMSIMETFSSAVLTGGTTAHLDLDVRYHCVPAAFLLTSSVPVGRSMQVVYVWCTDEKRYFYIPDQPFLVCT